MKKLTSGFFTPINPIGMLITGIYMVLWGLWLFAPFWEAFAATDTLYDLLHVVPEEILGGITSVLGLTIVAGSLWNIPKMLLQSACFLSFLVWLGVSVTLLLGNWQSPTWLGSALPAALAMYFYLNIAVSKEQNLTHNRR